MYENSDKFVLNRKSRFSHFEVCCSYTFIKKPERVIPNNNSKSTLHPEKPLYSQSYYHWNLY
jgi:hypothetical protein